MSNNKSRNVFDGDGNAYTLDTRIGEGGQGIVFTTKEKNVLVKLLNSRDKEKVKAFNSQLKWLLAQDLEGVNLALPKAIIESPLKGYVMEMMDELHPLEKVVEESYLGLAEDDSIEKYLSTGGIRRRLKILLNLAKLLAEIHGRGYAYGDLSPANIFVSEDSAHSQVWLIDCDNLCFQERQSKPSVHTPGYGAPEVVKYGANINCTTDAWSFAVVAFELLTHQHPFKGLAVEDGEPEVVEELAHKADFPWVYDSSDNSNEPTGGIPIELVTSSRLKDLFKRCFEDGRDRSWSRPSMAQWRDALQEALDQQIVCVSGCRSSFFYSSESEEQVCALCETVAPGESYTVFSQWINDDDDTDEWHYTGIDRVLNEGESLEFNSRPYNSSLWFDEDPLIAISQANGDIRIELEPGCSALVSRGTQSHTIIRNTRITSDRRDEKHPYMIVAWSEDEKADMKLFELVKSYRWTFA